MCPLLKQEHQKELYDRKRHGDPYQVGDLVWLHSSVVPRGYSRKLHLPWTGPYKVLKRLSDVTYRIQSSRGRRCLCVVHFNRLRPCTDGMRFKEPLDASTVPGPQTRQLPVNPPLIIDDCSDDDAPAISSTVHGVSPLDSEVTQNVSSTPANGDDQVINGETRQESLAADTIDPTNFSMEPAISTDSNRYPRCVHCPCSIIMTLFNTNMQGIFF